MSCGYNVAVLLLIILDSVSLYTHLLSALALKQSLHNNNMIFLDRHRASVSSYRFSIVNRSLFAVVWLQFATQVVYWKFMSYQNLWGTTGNKMFKT